MASRTEARLVRSGDALELAVELVWLEPASDSKADAGASRRVVRRALRLAAGTTLAAAIADALPQSQQQALVSGALTLAIFGERRPLGTILQEGDRIEVLEPLRVDPKQSRARRAQVQRDRAGDARWQKR